MRTIATVVPPIKCQGIKTKLVPTIQAIVGSVNEKRWVEPFCGSCVVAFNLKPQTAILADSNQHIIRFYQSIQNGSITSTIVGEYLETESQNLLAKGEKHYYLVRERFNTTHAPLDFLFLNRSCFNGLIRFNQKGQFNVPFCRKPHRFTKSYITKIVNQVRRVEEILDSREWVFQVADFTSTLSHCKKDDLVYVDPPYLGRHTDYYNAWNEQNEEILITQLKQLPGPFVLSTWQENRFRSNPAIAQNWQNSGLRIIPIQHFYHIGATETQRHSMIEALITNL